MLFRSTERGYGKLREAGSTHIASVRRLFVERYSPEEIEQLASLLIRLPGASQGGECTVEEDAG